MLSYTRIKPRSRPPSRKSAYFTHPDFSAAKIGIKKCANYASNYGNYVRDNWLQQLEVGQIENFIFKVREGIFVFVTKIGLAVDSTKRPVLWVGLLVLFSFPLSAYVYNAPFICCHDVVLTSLSTFYPCRQYRTSQQILRDFHLFRRIFYSPLTYISTA